MDEIKRDVDRAKRIDDILSDEGFHDGCFPSGQYKIVDELISAIKDANQGLDTMQPSLSEGIDDGEEQELNSDDERLAWFSMRFREKPTIEDSVYHLLTWRRYGGQSCFLGDANSLLLSGDFFSEAVDYIRNSFPTLNSYYYLWKNEIGSKEKSRRTEGVL